MREEKPELHSVGQRIAKCNHLHAEYMGATHMTLAVETGKVTSKHGALIGHHHFRCRCGHWFGKAIWEQPMTIKHEADAAKALVET